MNRTMLSAEHAVLIESHDELALPDLCRMADFAADAEKVPGVRWFDPG